MGNYSHKTVVIVGGGFSGAMAMANLVDRAALPLTIEWFDPTGHGKGVAYGTDDPSHLLNVRAGNMSAFPDKPDDFVRWQQCAPESFAPRKDYGRYLAHIAGSALQQAAEKNITVNLHTSEVQTISPSLTVNGVLAADAIILATGNQPPKARPVDHPAYIADIWNRPADFAARVKSFPADSHILIIGTGLTAIDTVLTLHSHGYKGTISALSRNGHVNHPHAAFTLHPSWLTDAPHTALGLLTRIRREVKKGHDWRGVIDALRPITQDIWQNLPEKEKRRVMHRLFTFWNIHRHRMAPEISAQITALQTDKRLNIFAARLLDVQADGNNLSVTYRTRGTTAKINASLVINCTGPDYDISTTEHLLLRNMHKAGVIQPGPLGMGVAINHASGIFPMGTLLVGEYFECTAVPELRVQAKNIADAVLRHIENPAQPATHRIATS